jgi:hypothetical protein
MAASAARPSAFLRRRPVEPVKRANGAHSGFVVFAVAKACKTKKLCAL